MEDEPLLLGGQNQWEDWVGGRDGKAWPLEFPTNVCVAGGAAQREQEESTPTWGWRSVPAGEDQDLQVTTRRQTRQEQKCPQVGGGRG